MNIGDIESIFTDGKYPQFIVNFLEKWLIKAIKAKGSIWFQNDYHLYHLF